MVKIIDIDKLFDDYISDYVYKNIGKVKPEQIENEMPKLYEQFGNEKLKQLDGKTPNTYYLDFSAKQLIQCLKEHLIKGIAISDFLCEAIISNKDCAQEIREELQKENEEQFVVYLINILNDMDIEPPFGRYLEFVLFDYPESIAELSTEILCSYADKVKEKIIEQYSDANEKTQERLAEILSNAKKDDRVFDILIQAFACRQDNIPLHAAFLSKYGDERALPFLLTAIESDKISYADFEELRFAIESLGGEYNKTRDISKDKTYKIINKINKEKNKR